MHFSIIKNITDNSRQMRRNTTAGMVNSVERGKSGHMKTTCPFKFFKTYMINASDREGSEAI